jgi:malonyl CoA-acyl carrier protein transacylase
MKWVFTVVFLIWAVIVAWGEIADKGPAPGTDAVALADAEVEDLAATEAYQAILARRVDWERAGRAEHVTTQHVRRLGEGRYEAYITRQQVRTVLVRAVVTSGTIERVEEIGQAGQTGE